MKILRILGIVIGITIVTLLIREVGWLSITQSLEMHIEEIGPGGRNRNHAHQNEAFFYVLEGAGYDIHDGVRYDWKAGDSFMIPNDSVHQHFNPGATRGLVLTFKSKAPSVIANTSPMVVLRLERPRGRSQRSA